MASEKHEAEELEESGLREPVATYFGVPGDEPGELTDAEVEAGETRHSERNED
jgi:hypothetical protein